jgi:CBS domain-containing protein
MTDKPVHACTFTIDEWMRTDIVTLTRHATVREAITLMLDHKTNGVVITHADGRVDGILSSWDIIKHIVPDYLEEKGSLAKFEASDVFCKRVEAVQNDAIELFMTADVKSIKQHGSLIEAVAMLSEFHIRQLPVVDDAGRLVGYLNRTDIKRAVGKVLDIPSYLT